MVKQDIQRYKLNAFKLVKGWFAGHAFYAVLLYRIGNWLYRHHVPCLPEMTRFRALRRYACEISPYAAIDGGFILHHTLGIVIGHEVIIGRNCEVFQNVTIGSNRKKKDGRGMPIIGDNVSIGAGAVVVGSIKIGNNVMIGANSYVDKDIPDGACVVGIPARIIRIGSGEDEDEVSDSF